MEREDEEFKNFLEYVEYADVIARYIEVTRGLQEDPLGWNWTIEKIQNYLKEKEVL